MRPVRTTININDALLEDLKKRAREEGRPMTRVVEDALQRGLSAGRIGKGKKRTVQAFPVGIKSAYRGMSMNQLYDQLEADDSIKASQ